MPTKYKLYTVAAVVAACAVVAVVLIVNVFGPTPVDQLCTEIIPKDQRVGIKIDKSKEQIKVSFSGERTVDKSISPEQQASFLRCLELQTKARVVVESGISIGLAPIG